MRVKIGKGEDFAEWDVIEKVIRARCEGDAECVAREMCRVYGPQQPRPIFGRALMVQRKR